jgi:integrase
MRMHERLTALAVRHAKQRGLHPDGLGLCLQVARNGSKSWIYRYRIGSRRRYLGLGSARDVTLAEARERAAVARSVLQNGQDPIEVKQGRRAATMLTAAKAMTFLKAATSYIEAHRAGWSINTTTDWVGSLAKHAYPIIGALPVSEIDTGLVLKVVEPLWSVKTEIANRVRGRIENILDWSKVRGFREGENPARWHGHLESLLPAKSKVAPVEHHAALPYVELPAFMVALRQDSAIASRALEFTILTASRSNEVYLADWSEIDLQTRVWTVPGARMKAGKDHRVPLSDAATALLGALPAPHTGIVFQGVNRGRPLGKTAMSLILHRVGRDDVTVHGMRSAFRDWAAERTNYPHEVCEAALAHAVGNAVSRAYRRTDQFERRVRLMADWSSFCAGKEESSATVTELRRA